MQCRNCNTVLPASAKYCPNCAQKNTTGKVNAIKFLGAFFAQHFNLESRLFRSLRDLLIPGKLTLEYFKGRHKSYVHPMQLFFVLGVLLFATINYTLKIQLNKSNIGVFNGKTIAQLTDDFKAMELIAEIDAISIDIENQFSNQLISSAFDTLRNHISLRAPNIKNFQIPTPSIIRQPLNSEGKPIKVISLKDVVSLTPEEIIKKYDVKDAYSKIQFRQIIKIMKDGGGFSSFTLGQGIWALMLTIPLLALFMKLLYIRKGRFYVEHLIFGFHFHAFAFIILTPFVLISSHLPAWLIITWILVIFAWLFFAMSNYFQQGLFKTFVKFWLLLIAYLFASAIGVTFVFLFTILLY